MSRRRIKTSSFSRALSATRTIRLQTRTLSRIAILSSKSRNKWYNHKNLTRSPCRLLRAPLWHKVITLVKSPPNLTFLIKRTLIILLTKHLTLSQETCPSPWEYKMTTHSLKKYFTSSVDLPIKLTNHYTTFSEYIHAEFLLSFLY